MDLIFCRLLNQKIFSPILLQARKLFRYRFQHSDISRISYDILTMLTTRVFMAYLAFPFVLLEFNASLRLYLKLYMCLHLIGLITIYVLPRFIRGEPKSQQIQKQANGTTVTAEKYENNVVQAIVDKIATETLHQNGIDAKKWALNNGPIIVADTDNSLTNNCDIKISKEKYENGITRDDSTNASTVTPSSNGVANHTNQPLHSLSDTNRMNNNHICDENNHRCDKNNHLSQKIRVRIDSETRNIEEFIDKTVTGIVELKEDLMRVSGDELNATNLNGLRKRAHSGGITNGCGDSKDTADTFLRKEINMAVNNKQLPAVLSNGHGD